MINIFFEAHRLSKAHPAYRESNPLIQDSREDHRSSSFQIKQIFNGSLFLIHRSSQLALNSCTALFSQVQLSDSDHVSKPCYLICGKSWNTYQLLTKYCHSIHGYSSKIEAGGPNANATDLLNHLRDLRLLPGDEDAVGPLLAVQLVQLLPDVSDRVLKQSSTSLARLEKAF